ncbi:hypothetical protein ALC60_04779 [Trachymyrmex zeteki]|uniref:Uncharacterized protein n=1 Tax=Mycetomoellerius zeteki TaxID=64791 RepID=A0A151X7M1_9HYME|nr:hypothetical protein ALC60_04779 [Trachymyrmex zeteki]
MPRLCSPSQSLQYASIPMQQRVAGASGTALDVRSFGSLSRAIIEIRGLSDWSDERVITKDKPQKGSPKGGVPKKIPILKITSTALFLLSNNCANFTVPLPSFPPPLFATELEKLGKVSTVAVGTLGVCKAAGDESGGPLWRTTPTDHLDMLLDEFCNNSKVFGNNETRKEGICEVGDEARLHIGSTNPLNAMSGCMSWRLVEFFFTTGLVASSCSLLSRGFPFFSPNEMCYTWRNA